MDPCRACEWTSPRRLDKITNGPIRRSRGELISKSSHFSSALCGATQHLRPFCMSMIIVCPGAGQKHLFGSQDASWPLTNHQLSLNMIECDSASVAEITLEGRSSYLLFSSHWLIQYQCACVLAFLCSTLLRICCRHNNDYAYQSTRSSRGSQHSSTALKRRVFPLLWLLTK